MTITRLVLVIAAAIATAGTAAAQTPTVPVTVGHCGLTGTGVTDALTAAYQSSRWSDLYALGATLIAGAKNSCDQAPEVQRIDLNSDYVLLAWEHDNQFSEKAVFTVLLHASKADPQPSTIPGVGTPGAPRLIQFFVAARERDAIASIYVSVEQENPLAAQLPAVAAAIVDPLFGTLGLLKGTIGERPKALARGTTPPEPTFWVTVARVDLPFRRASIEAELRAKVSVTGSEIHDKAAALASSVSFEEVPYVDCARSYATALATLIDGETADACSRDPDKCGGVLQPKMMQALGAAEMQCAGVTSGDTKAGIKAVRQVDGEFRKLIGTFSDATVTTKLSLVNAPLSRFSFGLMTAYVARASTRGTRAKIDGGKIVADPLPRQMAAVLVNGAFKAYDAGRPHVTASERYRWFAGFAVKPDSGLLAGLSALLVRGLAVNVGGTLFASSIPAGGENIGQEPVAPSKPFKTGTTFGVVVGASYNFK